MSIANPNLHHDNPEKRAADKLKRTSSVASFSVATLLVIFKFTAFLSTNSVSLLSSLMDSAFDAVASLLILVSIIHAASPADEDHRFGHSKIEALGALAQSLFILGSALLLLIESLRRLAHPQEIHDPAKGIGDCAQANEGVERC